MTTPDIFLSYNREDAATAKLFADAFTREGLNVWWDATLRSGEAYDEVTEAALRGAKAVVVLWSPRSVVSRWVRAEATIADRCKTLVPVTIEPCERPIMFELTQTADLSHWIGNTADKAWLAFLDDVRRMAVKADHPHVSTPTTPVTPPTVEETLKPGQSGSAPSLAVLPFTNRSSLPEDEVFAEGMVEDIISALSQGVNVRVLGATATTNLSRAAITDLSAVGRQLGVRYLLEGNVRRVGTNLRVTAQLLEVETSAVMWTGKFDRPLSELAELQEELVIEIAASLDTQVYALEMERALKKPSDITAWEAVARAWSAYRKWDAAARAKGIEESRRAIAIAPDYAPGHAMLAVALADTYLTSPDDPAEVQRIRAIVERAVGLAPDDVSVLGVVGQALSYIGYPDEGLRHSERAVRKAPGIGSLHYHHGAVCLKLNRLDEALSHFKTAERLSPGWNLMWAIKCFQSYTHWAQACWAEADTVMDECLNLLPSLAIGNVAKALYSKRLGQDGKAPRHIELARRLGCDLSQAERNFRGVFPSSPQLDADIANIRPLWAETEDAS